MHLKRRLRLPHVSVALVFNKLVGSIPTTTRRLTSRLRLPNGSELKASLEALSYDRKVWIILRRIYLISDFLHGKKVLNQDILVCKQNKDCVNLNTFVFN